MKAESYLSVKTAHCSTIHTFEQEAEVDDEDDNGEDRGEDDEGHED